MLLEDLRTVACFHPIHAYLFFMYTDRKKRGKPGAGWPSYVLWIVGWLISLAQLVLFALALKISVEAFLFERASDWSPWFAFGGLAAAVVLGGTLSSHLIRQNQIAAGLAKAGYRLEIYRKFGEAVATILDGLF